MRHKKKSEKFSRPRAQRKALIKSLLRSLVIYERIKTTESKAKAIKSWMDKLITLAKRGDLHSRRLSYRILGDHQLVKRLFVDLGPRFKDLKGGYTRVVDLGHRKGDGALVSILELTRVEKKKKIKRKKEEKKKKEEKVEKRLPPKEEKPKKGFISGVRKIFKKERDAL